jgi:Asp-tRNA(Asn)/Glu-tRNA(Gln) amidotransferase A subunit family amidase
MHIPTGTIMRDGEEFKVGVQIMANHWREDLLFGIGKDIEKYRN